MVWWDVDGLAEEYVAAEPHQTSPILAQPRRRHTSGHIQFLPLQGWSLNYDHVENTIKKQQNERK